MLWKLIAGVALIAAALGTRYYAEPRLQTAGAIAIDRPVSLVPGHISASFFAGYNARYRAGIRFKAPQELPFKKPNCIPAPYFPPDDCSGIPSNLNISWALSSRGQIIQHGSASPTIWNRSGSPFLTFMLAHLEGGRIYKLDVDLLNDGSQFAPAQPQLSVHVSQPEFAESFALCVATLTRIGYGLVGAVGVGLLIAALLRRSQNSTRPQGQELCRKSGRV